MDAELKALFDEQAKTLDAFKAKNDALELQVKKHGEDAVTKAELKAINDALDAGLADFKKRQDEIEARANRLALNGQGDQAEAKAAADFGRILGKGDITVDAFKEYKASLNGYLRSGEVKATVLQVGSDAAGGYLVTPDASGRMIKKIYESSPMRQLASVQTIGTDAFEGMIDNGEADAAWVGEKQTRSRTDSPELGKWTIPANELYAYPKTTLKILEDANIDVEAWLMAKAADKMARKETTAFYTGTGIIQPRGILSYDFASTADATRSWGTFQYVASGASGAFASSNPADKILDLIYELKAGYRPNARFQCARRTKGAIRKLKDGQGNYLVDLRLRDGAMVETIFGFEAIDAEDMPALAADSYSLAFGDWAETYQIVDRVGISVRRDEITEPGFVKFHVRKRTGGGVVNFESAKFMKFATS